MEIDWRILLATSMGFGVSSLFLLKALLGKRGEVQRLEADNKQTHSELLRTRGQHAIEMAQLNAEHAKVVGALQGNLNDLTTLLKEHNKSQWDGWLQKQRKRFGSLTPQG